MQASVARGAVKASFRASPNSPAKEFFFACGWTLARRVAPAGVSWIGIIQEFTHYSFENAPPTKVIVIPAQNEDTDAMIWWIRVY
jgi:hypothetical protein